MLTNKEKEQVEALITALVNDAIHYGSYERIAMEGRDFSADFLNELEDNINKSAQELGDCIVNLVKSREKVGHSKK